MATNRFLRKLMERTGHCNTGVSVRPGSSRVVVEMDFIDRDIGKNFLLTTDEARRIAQTLLETADQVDTNMAHCPEEELCPICGWSVDAYGCYVGVCRDPLKQRVDRARE